MFTVFQQVPYCSSMMGPLMIRALSWSWAWSPPPQSFLALPSLCSVSGRWGWGADPDRLHFKGLCTTWFLAGFGQEDTGGRGRRKWELLPSTPSASSCWSKNFSFINLPIFQRSHFSTVALWPVLSGALTTKEKLRQYILHLKIILNE